MHRGVIALAVGLVGVFVNLCPLLWVKYAKGLSLAEYRSIALREHVESRFECGESEVLRSTMGYYVYVWGMISSFYLSLAGAFVYRATPLLVLAIIAYVLVFLVSLKYLCCSILITNRSVYVCTLFPFYKKIKQIVPEAIKSVKKKSCVNYVTIEINGKSYYDDTPWKNADAIVIAIQNIQPSHVSGV